MGPVQILVLKELRSGRMILTAFRLLVSKFDTNQGGQGPNKAADWVVVAIDFFLLKVGLFQSVKKNIILSSNYVAYNDKSQIQTILLRL